MSPGTDGGSPGLFKSRIPALGSVRFLLGLQFPYLSERLCEDWGEGWEILQVKVLYDPHKPGGPTKCFCLRAQEAELATPVLLEAIERSPPAVTFLPGHLSVGRSQAMLSTHSVPAACLQSLLALLKGFIFVWMRGEAQ